MKKLILAAAVAGAVLLSSAAQAQTTPEGYQLQQVLMMSRHNLRAPLANNGSVLEQSTPNQWPEWDVPGGQLTTKGGVLEIYMGHYMREWLAELGMVTSALFVHFSADNHITARLYARGYRLRPEFFK